MPEWTDLRCYYESYGSKQQDVSNQTRHVARFKNQARGKTVKSFYQK